MLSYALKAFIKKNPSKEDRMIRRKTIAISAVLLMTAFFGLSIAVTADTAQSANNACDRTCLSGFVTKYLDAMVAHKPGDVPVASNVRFTEDCKELKLGEGLWKDISRLRDYRRDILDVRQGVAVSFLVGEVAGAPVLYVVRLKIADNKIAEIETTAVRNKEEGMLFNIENLQTVSKMMVTAPEKSQLNSRDDMIKMALTYPAGLKIGSFVKADSPMAPDAYRFENGQLMAGPGCTFFKGCDNMKTQMIPTLSKITHRVIAVDEELGVVALRMNFGPGSLFQGNGELDVWHSFKIYGGQIHAAEAYCEIVPAGTKYGWE
jgi:hypothetical protein